MEKRQKTIMDAYQVIRDFEKALCSYTGAPYCVTVESCSAALFLCCLRLKVKEISEISIPKITYPSAACAIVNAGGRILFEDIGWQKQGWYWLKPTDPPIIDSAKFLSRDMYPYLNDGSSPLVCLSFHAKKAIPIGRGGAILTDSKEAYNWLKCMRFDGRHECALDKDVLEMPGFNMYLEPEQAARGLQLMQWIKDENILPPDPYQDLSIYDFFTRANR